jgi:filamentous hemagglutinin
MGGGKGSNLYNSTYGSKIKHLPNVENAVFAIEKLTQYALDPTSNTGKNKARVFERALGFNSSNANFLREQVLTKLPNTEAIVAQKNEFGQKYTVYIDIVGINGNIEKVITGWIIEDDVNYPRLTSIYVAKGEKK